MSAPDGRRAGNDTSEAPPAGSCPGTSGTEYYAHPSAVIDEGAVIGKGTKIWHFCHVMPGAVIGERCILGQNVVVMPGTRIGTNVKIQNNVSIYEGVVLEDDVFCGPSMVFTNVTFPRSHVVRKGEYERTLCKQGATIGANATVICGTTLGRFSFVGAGAVVTKDVKDHALVVGNPAKQAGWMCQCGERLHLTKGKGTCSRCGTSYAERKGELVRQ